MCSACMSKTDIRDYGCGDYLPCLDIRTNDGLSDLPRVPKHFRALPGKHVLGRSALHGQRAPAGVGTSQRQGPQGVCGSPLVRRSELRKSGPLGAWHKRR